MSVYGGHRFVTLVGMNAALSDDVDDRPTIPLVRPRVAVEPIVGGGMLARANRARRVELVAIPMVSAWTFGAGMRRPSAFHGRAIIAVIVALAALVAAYVTLVAV